MFKKTIPILICLTTLTGCISLFPDPGPAPDYVHLNPDFSKHGSKSSAVQIIVEEPSADSMHNSTNIIVANPPQQQKYKVAAGKEWFEKMPTFVQRDLVKAISNKGVIGVETSSKGIKADYVLLCNINKFLVSMANPEKPVVIIDADFSLVQAQGRKIVAKHSFVSSQESEEGFDNILKSFDYLYSDMLDDVSDWVINWK